MNAVRQSDASAIPALRTLAWAGFLLGFGMGGFFDGILLHQVLQWHHLLSLVPGEPFRDIKVQILADGLFHVLMYLIAAIGLWKLWKARRAAATGDRLLLASAAFGFGVWNIVDAVLFHWVLRIHHIRLDVNPLLWDLLWFVVFGLAFVALTWWLNRGEGPVGGGKSAAALVLAVLVGGPVAALPPRDTDTVMVFFKPGTTPNQVFAGIEAVDGRILWAAPTGDVWALDVRDKAKTALLYRHGAFLVSNSALALGCVKWTSAKL
ncbi:DUF2243 domain-containing protein [Massilia sp. Dwa41.01b]|uniref:DUF2243 domain-containing protein n=1 Tax=Massilia sp. Dwa41.01b TaxID=2709302 RepID=UPI0015FFC7EB|nr:DUF2243 domain-containing protein [Massilia sp. Dwa41.01b]QNA88450.1 DUF2243 domain-containing protein [Massilia sp. Dwa41.01b]